MKILKDNEPILKIKTPIYNFEDDDLKIILDLMYSTMVNNNGVGLAAPQVGISKRFFIMGDNTSYKEYINPVVLERSENEIEDYEGCLSFPDLKLKIKRNTSIKVRYQRLDKTEIVEDLSGLWARCFLHELDHLDGITFDKKISKLKLDLMKRKNKKGTI